jgi:aerobic-type carbon monoxide dehydrogenase small subunit (CoxS/CutS family)
MAISFKVNGGPVSVDAPQDTPLLWVIREQLKLTGTKFGCGVGLCGACVVHVDGKRAFSCQTQISNVADKQVTTIEGLSHDGSVLIDAVVNHTELATPPAVTVETAKGFSLHMLKAAINGRSDEIVELPKTNLWR